MNSPLLHTMEFLNTHNQSNMNTDMQDQCLRLIQAERWDQVRINFSSPKFSDEMTTSPMIVPTTLLHVACTVPSVPQDVFAALIHAFPQAVTMEDEDGALPIHHVCKTFTIRPDLIKILLNACPETSFRAAHDGHELPLCILLNHCMQNFGLKAVFDLLSMLSPSIIYNSQTSILHQINNTLLAEPICHKLIETYPEICKIHNNGNTLLHIMCSHPNSSASLIERIIQIYPQSCAIRDDNGNLPLHLVNSQQHSLEIIRLLMACYPHALLVQNSSGQVPLISPLIRSSSRRVKELLRSCTTAGNVCTNTVLQTRNRCGMYPIQDYCYELQQQISEKVLQGMISIDSLSSCGRMQSYTKLIANSLESLFYLMRVAIYNDVEYALNAPHQSSFWTTFPMFIKSLLHHSPELACHKDCNGNLPLHVIAKHECQQLHSIQCSSCSKNISGPYLLCQNKLNICKECSRFHQSNPNNAQPPLVEYQGNELIKDILAVNPSAAKVRDSEGSLPLHLSLRTGKAWSTGISELTDAAPFALRVVDNTKGTFPFMLAAEYRDSDETLNAGQKLTTIYELLKREPSQIQ